MSFKNLAKAPAKGLGKATKKSQIVTITEDENNGEIKANNRLTIYPLKGGAKLVFNALPMLGVFSTYENVPLTERANTKGLARSISKKKALELPEQYQEYVQNWFKHKPKAKTIPSPVFDETNALGVRRYNRQVEYTDKAGKTQTKWEMVIENAVQYLSPVYGYELIKDEFVAKQAELYEKSKKTEPFKFVKNPENPADPQWYVKVFASTSKAFDTRVYANLVVGREIKNGKVNDFEETFLAITPAKVVGTYTVYLQRNGAGRVKIVNAWKSLQANPVPPFDKIDFNREVDGLQSIEPTNIFAKVGKEELFIGTEVELDGVKHENAFYVYKIISARNTNRAKAIGSIQNDNTNKLPKASAAKKVKNTAKTASKPEARKTTKRKVDL